MRLTTLSKWMMLMAAVLLPLCGVLQAQTTLLVLSKHDHTLSVVDPVTLKVKAKAPVGEDPHEVIASSDGRKAYVSNYGYGALHSLAVIDLVTMKAQAPIELGPLHGPHGLTFVGSKTWFTAEGAKAIGRFDPATHKIDWVMGTGQNRTHMIYVAPDEKHILTSNVESGTISFIDLGEMKRVGPAPTPTTDWNETVVPVGRGSEGFDVSPDGKEVWAANAGDATISVIDRNAKKVVAILGAKVPGANRLKFTPDGKLVLVSAGPELVVLDAASRKVVKRIAIGHGSAGVLVQPDGKRAFVSCGPDNYVAVIDLVKLEVVGHIDVGGEPDGLAWAVR
jgi:YVTN family beta-propeller protein